MEEDCCLPLKGHKKRARGSARETVANVYKPEAGSQFLLEKHMICGQGLPQPYEGCRTHSPGVDLARKLVGTGGILSY